MTKSNTETQQNNKDNLVEEFAQLIASIGKDVSEEVIRGTAIKEMQELSSQMTKFRQSLPKHLQEMEQSSQIFNSTKNDVQSVLGGFVSQIQQQEKMLKKSLDEATAQHHSLRTSSYDSYLKAMSGQTAEILGEVANNGSAVSAKTILYISEAVKQVKAQQHQELQAVVQEMAATRKIMEKQFGTTKQALTNIATQSDKLITDKFEAAEMNIKKKTIKTTYLLATNVILILTVLVIEIWPYFPRIIRKLTTLI